MAYTVQIITVSDRCFRGERADADDCDARAAVRAAEIFPIFRVADRPEGRG